jgi:hypothetical protein
MSNQRKWKIDETALDHWIVDAYSHETGENILAGPMSRANARIVGDDYKGVGYQVTLRYINQIKFLED